MVKILVLDDEAEICEFTRNFLSKRNYQVFIAQTGKDALEIVKKERPHLALVDVRLNMESGLDVLREMKEIDKDIKVMMLTSFDDEESRHKALLFGADDYVVKPLEAGFVIDKVLSRIASLGLEDKP